MTYISNRTYIREYFNENQKFNAGDVIEFEMPSFCSGDYHATIYINPTNGEPYIDKANNYFEGCRDYYII